MKKLILVIIFITGSCISSNANSGWSIKGLFGGYLRWGAFSFEIGNKGYVGSGQGTGVGTYADLWEYDSMTDSWSQKANYPSSAAGNYNTSFSLNNKGYVACGALPANIINSDELWEYNNITNLWTQRAAFPGGNRKFLTSFVIGNYAYVGLGTEFINLSGVIQSDFYRYDPINDSWMQIANIAGGARTVSKGFAINGFGYVVGGQNQTGFINDLIQYNPSTNTWIAKQPHPAYLQDPCAETCLNEGYVLGGLSLTNSNLVYKYSPVTDSWISVANMPYGRSKAASFTLGDTIYIVAGNEPAVINIPTKTNQAFNAGSSVYIPEIDKNKHFIYPTISNGRLFLDKDLLNRSGLTEQILVFSTEGKLVKSMPMKSELNISDLPNGNYFLMIDSKKIFNRIILVK